MIEISTQSILGAYAKITVPVNTESLAFYMIFEVYKRKS